MGYDFDIDPKFNQQGEIIIQIKLTKKCYYPDETIKGIILLYPKTSIKNTKLTNLEIKLEIFQYQHYILKTGGKTRATVNIDEKLILISNNIFYPNLINIIMNGEMQIPFSMKLPNNIYPTCIFDRMAFVKHYLIISIPSLQIKKSDLIIIKNMKYFSLNNGLLKKPLNISKEIAKIAFWFFERGKIKLNVKMPKNYFDYNEEIQYEVMFDCTELELQIFKIIVSINRYQRKNLKINRSKVKIGNKERLNSKIYDFPENEKMFIIKDSMNFLNSTLNKNVCNNPSLVYKLLESKSFSEINHNITDYFLAPSCYGGLLSAEYYLKIEILFDTSFTNTEELKIPLDFYSIDE